MARLVREVKRTEWSRLLSSKYGARFIATGIAVKAAATETVMDGRILARKEEHRENAVFGWDGLDEDL